MIKSFRKIRQNLLMANRAERKENVQRTFLVNEPASRAGIITKKHD